MVWTARGWLGMDMPAAHWERFCQRWAVAAADGARRGGPGRLGGSDPAGIGRRGGRSSGPPDPAAAAADGAAVPVERYDVATIFPTVLAMAVFILTIFAVVIPFFEASLLEAVAEVIRELTNSAWSMLAELEATSRPACSAAKKPSGGPSPASVFCATAGNARTTSGSPTCSRGW